MKIRRALISVSDKEGVVELAQALSKSGTELVATGGTLKLLESSGLKVRSVESITRNPESFGGRMKTLSFHLLSGVLYQRGNTRDESEAKALGIEPIDAVIVNFYPFEQASKKPGISRDDLIEEVDIGGPTMVRAAAKNSKHVLVVSSPTLYADVIRELQTEGGVTEATREICAQNTWRDVAAYDHAIALRLSGDTLTLKYGENPHQMGHLMVDPSSPIAWPTGSDGDRAPISYNNILDASASYELVSGIKSQFPGCEAVAIFKHCNPCGVAVSLSGKQSQRKLLEMAWASDPVSAFGGVVTLSSPLEKEAAEFLSSKFVELIQAPGLSKPSADVTAAFSKKKNLKTLEVRAWTDAGATASRKKHTEMSVVGGVLFQDRDVVGTESLEWVTKAKGSKANETAARVGVHVVTSLKSNAVALLRCTEGGDVVQLIGTGQGQPNRVEAIDWLAVRRAERFYKDNGRTLKEAAGADSVVLVSDAFFPFPDSIEIAAAAGVTTIIQPGGSIKDGDVIQACDRLGAAMAKTGRRHFRHS